LLVSEMLIHALIVINSLNNDKIQSLLSVNIRNEVFSRFGRRIEGPENQQFVISSEGIKFGEIVIDKVTSILNFSNNILNKDGSVCQIGDNDSGRYLRLSVLDEQDKGGLFHTTFMKFYKYSSEDEITGGYFYSNILFDILRSTLKVSDWEIKQSEKPVTKSKTCKFNLKAFSDFGIYGFENDIYSTIFRCGAIGQNGKGGHSHNDQLSLILKIGDIDLLVDPGSYVYTALPDIRTTGMHNTLSVEKYEQNAWSENNPDDLFWMRKDKSKARILQLSDTMIIGEHYGFKKPHKRILNLKEKSIEGVDVCSLNRTKYVYFHLHPGIEISQEEAGRILLLKDKSGICDITTQEGVITVKEYYFSPSYGKKFKALKVVISSKSERINWQCNILK